MSETTPKCLDKLKECFALLIPALRPQQLKSSTSGYHDPNNPSGSSPKLRSKSVKKKKYQIVNNPNSVPIHH